MIMIRRDDRMKFPRIQDSLRGKLTLFLLIAIVVPMATSIAISYFFTKEKVVSESIQNNSSLIFQGRTNLTNYMNIIVQASLSPYTDLRTGDKNTMYEIMEQGLTDYTSESEIYSSLVNTSMSVKEIHQIYLYIAKSRSAYLMFHGNKKQDKNATSPIMKSNVPYKAYVESSHLSHEYGLKKQSPYYAPQTVISIHRPIYQIPSNKWIGMLSIDVKLNVIRSISEQLYSEGEELYIIDSDGNVIFAPNDQPLMNRSQDSWVQQTLQKTHQDGISTGFFESEDELFKGITIYENMKTSYLDWTIVKRIPYNVLYNNTRQLAQINLWVMCSFLIIVILGALYISVLFTKPIKQLIRYINKIESGQWHVDIHMDRSDEIGILARRFQAMMQTINNLIMKEYRLEIANKTNQLKALQAQIHPHFLNNALQSIGTLALQHQETKIYSLISSLGKMMRYNMNTSEGIVPLSKEMEHVKAYLQLQSQRFDNKLTTQFTMDSEAAEIIVPKMLLQPLVENYFKHGYEPQGGQGELFISCTVNSDRILNITVSNNGKNVPADRITELQERLEMPFAATEAQESLGLLNVLSRIQLYFTEEAQMKLENKEPHGFSVILLIPLQKGAEPLENSNRR